MAKPLLLHKGRTNIVSVSLGFDVSNDTFTSEIREKRDPESDLIATWTVGFATDGTDGELVLSLDDALTVDIEQTSGYMDIKRMSSGEPLSVFDEPLEVLIRNSVTV